MKIIRIIGCFLKNTGLAPEGLALAGALYFTIRDITDSVDHAVDNGCDIELNMSGFSIRKNNPANAGAGSNDEFSKIRGYGDSGRSRFKAAEGVAAD